MMNIGQTHVKAPLVHFGLAINEQFKSGHPANNKVLSLVGRLKGEFDGESGEGITVDVSADEFRRLDVFKRSPEGIRVVISQDGDELAEPIELQIPIEREAFVPRVSRKLRRALDRLGIKDSDLEAGTESLLSDEDFLFKLIADEIRRFMAQIRDGRSGPLRKAAPRPLSITV